MKKSLILYPILVGITLFSASIFIAENIIVTKFIWLPQVLLKLLLAVFSISIAILLKLPLKEQFSIRLNFNKHITTKNTLYALILGIIATVFILSLRIPRIPLLKELSFPQIILIIWILSSVCEEIFARGLVQGLISKENRKEITIGRFSFSNAVLAGAIVFSLIHFSIFIKGGSLLTAITTMFFTFILGLLAGQAKEKSNLASAIIVHIAFNVGGVIAGILFNIISVISTGHPISN